MKRRYLLLSLAAFAACFTAARAAPKDAIPKRLSEWLPTTPPAPMSERWRAANCSKYEWVVSQENGTAAVRQYDSVRDEASPLPFKLERTAAMRGRMRAVQVADGWLLGFDAGEWGGSLWWFSPDAMTQTKISDDQIRGFYPSENGVLAIEGLAHMGISEGKVLRVQQAGNGKWTATRLVDLKQAPETACKVSDGSLLVATIDRLLKVHPDGKTDVLLSKVFWRGLYPNSLVLLPSGDIYLGMRHGVGRITTKNGMRNVTFLLPNRAFINAKPQ